MLSAAKTKKSVALLLLAALAVVCCIAWNLWLRPTRILVVNALESQQADIVLSNDSRHIAVTCVEAEQMGALSGYDAVVIYARRIFLTDEQQAEVKRVAAKGVPVFTKTLRRSDFVANHNLTAGQVEVLQDYFDNETRQNLRNGLRYLRHLATPRRWGDQDYEHPMPVVKDMYYHREYGRYFKTAVELTDYLQEHGLYTNPTDTPLPGKEGNGRRLAFISGITFPMEGNRQHVDTLITMLTERGFNVYPLTASGQERERLLHELLPDAVVFMAMGRIGNDTLVGWLNRHDIPVFAPFPLSASHDEWMDARQPMSAGSKNARIVIPEIDGAVAPFCIGTQNANAEGYLMRTAEVERCQLFCDYISRYMTLRQKPNSQKRIAIGFFKRPGKDALLASGMEVIPSMYNFLRRLRQEGYDVSGLPSTLEAFTSQLRSEAQVLGTYAEGAQRQYMDKGHPVWLSSRQYEAWAREVLDADSYAAVVSHYGPAPGTLLARGDSLAVACLRYGNVLIFPQPRPALGDDDFRVEHGIDVPPPHSYLAPYLYMQQGFRADAIIHFGTHGNLEFTPGRDAAMRRQDWSQQLIGATPHFYFYTTANIGEAIIAKRRSAAILVTYLTPPYAESGMRQKYEQLHRQVHKALSSPDTQTSNLKSQLIKEGLHRPLGLDSTTTRPLTEDELERIDAHLEELMNENMQAAYYTLGQPYTDEQLQQTVRAMNDDPEQWPRLKQLLRASTEAELDNMVHALSGGAIAPAPGGDPVQNDNVLPTGRNMFSINPENTPDEQAWDDGKRLAEETLARYQKTHGEYPQKVSYTFWAGEFIATGGATIAQALWMLGVEPVRDSQGRIASLRLVPAAELGRPRIDVVVQVSGQLRDIADSRLKLITEAVRLASEAQDDSPLYVNYVRRGTLAQQQALAAQGNSPVQVSQLSVLRVFGPANNGYSTGMMDYIERSGSWDDASELVDGYLNNMCAAYGADSTWGLNQRDLFQSALQGTDVTVQPRQSNTWGPLSLDHVYEFTGGLSMAVRQLSGKEPDAMLADYRNRRNRRLQGLREAIDVEARTTLLNPQFIRERMKGDEGTAQMFGETFRNVFGWNVTRPSAVDEQLYDDLYGLYMEDNQQLGIHDFFRQKNPAALQAMTAVMLESARKGYWKPTDTQLKTTLKLHTDLTRDFGPACTDFVCNNRPLQQFIAGHVPEQVARQYNDQLANVKDTPLNTSLTQRDKLSSAPESGSILRQLLPWLLLGLILLTAIIAMMVVRRRKQKNCH